MAAAKKDEKAKDPKKDAGKDSRRDDEDTPDEESVAAAKEAKKKKIKKILMFVGLGILLIGGSVGGTLFAVKSMLHKQMQVDGQAAAESSSSEESKSESSAAAEPIKPAIYVALKPNFMVNYDVNGRQRFLQAELTFMYREESVASVVELHMPEIRNGLVMLLSNQSFDDLQTVEGKEKLRSAALQAVQEIIEKETLAAQSAKEKEAAKTAKKAVPNIEQILFTSFVMQ